MLALLEFWEETHSRNMGSSENAEAQRSAVYRQFGKIPLHVPRHEVSAPSSPRELLSEPERCRDFCSPSTVNARILNGRLSAETLADRLLAACFAASKSRSEANMRAFSEVMTLERMNLDRLLKQQRRGGRVAECGGLLNRCTG